MLLQAGLGCKKIKLLEDDTDEDVLNKLTSDAKDEFGNTLGFPQARTCGGFEMLQRLANSKNTSVSGTLWSVCNLQSALGGQAKIYLRPKQPKRSVFVEAEMSLVPETISFERAEVTFFAVHRKFLWLQ